MKRDPETNLAKQIRAELWQARERLGRDPQANPLTWPIPCHLACSQRPLRDHPNQRFGGSGKPLPPEAGPEVIAWVQRVRDLGIRSVICLMHPKELRYYEGLQDMPGGLLDLYRSHGLEVRHIEWADPAHARTEEAREALRNRVREIKLEAYAAYRRLARPVLLHCSAGIDRSAPVAAYIALQERGTGAA